MQFTVHTDTSKLFNDCFRLSINVFSLDIKDFNCCGYLQYILCRTSPWSMFLTRKSVIMSFKWKNIYKKITVTVIIIIIVIVVVIVIRDRVWSLNEFHQIRNQVKVETSSFSFFILIRRDYLISLQIYFCFLLLLWNIRSKELNIFIYLFTHKLQDVTQIFFFFFLEFFYTRCKIDIK